MLREGDGIGTSATRASIISELKRREFLAVKGKQIISTTLGRSVIDALPEVVKSPVLTALYERMLKASSRARPPWTPSSRSKRRSSATRWRRPTAEP
jgi:DNA topoisomerase IA